MSIIIVGQKNAETQHLRFLDALYREFLIAILGWVFGFVWQKKPTRIAGRAILFYNLV